MISYAFYLQRKLSCLKWERSVMCIFQICSYNKEIKAEVSREIKRRIQQQNQEENTKQRIFYQICFVGLYAF